MIMILILVLVLVLVMVMELKLELDLCGCACADALLRTHCSAKKLRTPKRDAELNGSCFYFMP